MYPNDKQSDLALALKITAIVVGILVLIIALFGSWKVIDAGERGVVLRVGKVERTMNPGFNWKLPLIEKVVKMEVRTLKLETEATAASKDLQDVTTNIALQYNLNAEAVGSIYTEYEQQVRSRVIDPAIQDAVKAGTAQFVASELITNRSGVKDIIENTLRVRLAEANITVTNLDIINFSFSASFATAIEEKVTAEQNADREENKLRQVEAEANQRIAQAKAEAEAIKIQAEAVNSQGGADYVQLQAIQKWDGHLPQQFVPGSAIPFLSI